MAGKNRSWRNIILIVALIGIVVGVTIGLCSESAKFNRTRTMSKAVAKDAEWSEKIEHDGCLKSYSEYVNGCLTEIEGVLEWADKIDESGKLSKYIQKSTVGERNLTAMMKGFDREYQEYANTVNLLMQLCNAIDSAVDICVDEECVSEHEEILDGQENLFLSYVNNLLSPEYIEANATYFSLINDKYLELLCIANEDFDVSQQDMRVYYESEILSNSDYVRGIEVKIQETDTTVTSKDILEMCSFVTDPDFYDEGVAPYTLDAAMFMFNNNLMSASTDDNGLVIYDITGIDNVEEFIDEKRAQEKEDGTTYKDCSLTLIDGLTAELHMDVISCTHDYILDFDKLMQTKWGTDTRLKVLQQNVIDGLIKQIQGASNE